VKVGDLVAHKHDINRKIECVGVVVKMLKNGEGNLRDEALVAWASESAPVPAWYYLEYLEVINESR
jgi:hypothetical protein